MMFGMVKDGGENPQEMKGAGLENPYIFAASNMNLQVSTHVVVYAYAYRKLLETKNTKKTVCCIPMRIAHWCCLDVLGTFKVKKHSPVYFFAAQCGYLFGPLVYWPIATIKKDIKLVLECFLS